MLGLLIAAANKKKDGAKSAFNMIDPMYYADASAPDGRKLKFSNMDVSALQGLLVRLVDGEGKVDFWWQEKSRVEREEREEEGGKKGRQKLMGTRRVGMIRYRYYGPTPEAPGDTVLHAAATDPPGDLLLAGREQEVTVDMKNLKEFQNPRNVMEITQISILGEDPFHLISSGGATTSPPSSPGVPLIILMLTEFLKLVFMGPRYVGFSPHAPAVPEAMWPRLDDVRLQVESVNDQMINAFMDSGEYMNLVVRAYPMPDTNGTSTMLTFNRGNSPSLNEDIRSILVKGDLMSINSQWKFIKSNLRGMAPKGITWKASDLVPVGDENVLHEHQISAMPSLSTADIYNRNYDVQLTDNRMVKSGGGTNRTGDHLQGILEVISALNAVTMDQLPAESRQQFTVHMPSAEDAARLMNALETLKTLKYPRFADRSLWTLYGFLTTKAIIDANYVKGSNIQKRKVTDQYGTTRDVVEEVPLFHTIQINLAPQWADINISNSYYYLKSLDVIFKKYVLTYMAAVYYTIDPLSRRGVLWKHMAQSKGPFMTTLHPVTGPFIEKVTDLSAHVERIRSAIQRLFEHAGSPQTLARMDRDNDAKVLAELQQMNPPLTLRDHHHISNSFEAARDALRSHEPAIQNIQRVLETQVSRPGKHNASSQGGRVTEDFDPMAKLYRFLVANMENPRPIRRYPRPPSQWEQQ